MVAVGEIVDARKLPFVAVAQVQTISLVGTGVTAHLEYTRRAQRYTTYGDALQHVQKPHRQNARVVRIRLPTPVDARINPRIN